MKPVTTMKQMSDIRKKASAATLALLLVTGSYSTALFGFNISETSTRWKDSAIQVTVSTDIELSQDVIDAISIENFTITITTQIKIYRERENYWDDLIAEFEIDDAISYRSTYHTYQVTSSDERVSGRYKTLKNAVKALEKTRVFEIAVAKEVLTEGESYRGKCKVFLRHSKLHSLLRKRVFFKKSWRLGSGWKQFNLQ